MIKDLRRWAEHVQEVKPTMNLLVQGLVEYGATISEEDTYVISELPYRAQFRFGSAVVTIAFILKDYQTDSDVVITNLTTLPPQKMGLGYGTRAVQFFIQWAADNNLKEIRATQISGEKNEKFWEKNGFQRCPQPNPCNDFTRLAVAEKPT